MKRVTLAIIFASFTLVLAAQDAIRVNYKGAQPTISDFVSALVDHNLNAVDEEECCNESFDAASRAWDRHRKGLPLEEGETVTVDEKNGYVVYEYRSEYESTENVLRVEMCYWNEADKKHKLFACNTVAFTNGKYDPGQYDALIFYRYDIATKKMKQWDDTGVDFVYRSDDDVMGSYALPRAGKDITVTLWYKSGKKQKTLKWNGRRFVH
ncbi:MAG: hypothetical protein IKW98_13805 [Prevotella sp.]|nr:hypothetical protein [Prevotella sp.]